MRRVRNENINTVDFWDYVWEREGPWFDGHGLWHYRYTVACGPLKPGDTVLDVGGGRGEFLEWLGPEHHRTLLDHSRWAVEHALEQGRADAGVVADCTKPLPFDDDAFDAVFCTEVIEHVEDPRALAAELRRVSRGFVAISTPYKNTVDDKQHVWSFDEDDIRDIFSWGEPQIDVIGGPTMVAVIEA